MAKVDMATKIYKDVFNHEIDDAGVNEHVKAVIVNFGDERGDIIVTNDNFGTRRKHADFTKGKEAAGLHPMQIVWSGWDAEKISHTKYINEHDEVVEC
jgi:hypothetical protein